MSCISAWSFDQAFLFILLDIHDLYTYVYGFTFYFFIPHILELRLINLLINCD